MGGTFDPVHHGHLSAASEVAARFALDEVVFVPTGRPWQKSDASVSPSEDRYLMTVIATASNPRFSVSRIEVDRPGATYTIDTLRALHEAHAETHHPGITVMNIPALAISSTDVRARVAEGRPIRYLVPEGVNSYVQKAGLYR